MEFLQSLLSAYVAPEMAAQQAAEYKRAAPQRTASAWEKIKSMTLDKPVVGGSVDALYTPQPTSSGSTAETGDIFNALTAQKDMPAPGDRQQLTPLERMRQEISAMITSGDPVLQKTGTDLLKDYYGKSTTASKKDIPLSTAGKQAFDEGFKYGTKPFQNRVKQIRSENKTKMFEDTRVGHNDRFQDANGNPVDVPAGTTLKKVQEMGLYPLKATSADSAGKIAMNQTAIEQIPIIDKYFPEDNSGFTPKTMAALSAIENLPFGIGDLAARGFAPEAQELYAAFETGMQAITRTETGAAMASEEIDNTKKRFMPKAVDTDIVKRQKIDAYKYFLANADSLLNNKTGSGKNGQLTESEAKAVMDEAYNKSMEEASQSKTWVEGGYEYRKTPDGRTQRRKL